MDCFPNYAVCISCHHVFHPQFYAAGDQATEQQKRAGIRLTNTCPECGTINLCPHCDGRLNCITRQCMNSTCIGYCKMPEIAPEDRTHRGTARRMWEPLPSAGHVLRDLPRSILQAPPAPQHTAAVAV